MKRRVAVALIYAMVSSLLIGFLLGFIAGSFTEEPSLELRDAWVVDRDLNTTKLHWLTDGMPRKVLFVSYVNHDYEEHIRLVRISIISRNLPPPEMAWDNRPLGELIFDCYDLYYTSGGTFAVQLRRPLVGYEKVEITLAFLEVASISKEFRIE